MRLRQFTILLALLGGNAFASVDQDIKRLMEQGQYGSAYQLGKQHSELLGQPGFDFFFGIAALDGGSPGEGVLALERFLLVYPDNHSARFHLARGYYILGEDQRAHREFVDLLTNANLEEKVTIERFLDAIRARESRYLPTASFFVESGIGYDSNINAGTRTGDVAGLPGFVVTGNSSSAEERDFFYLLNTGVQGSLPIVPGVMLYGGLQGNARWHPGTHNDVFDQLSFGAQGGINLITGRNLLRAGIEHNQLSVNNNAYLRSSSLIGEWAHQFDQFNRFGGSLQYSQLRYENVTIYLDKEKKLASPSGAPQRDSDMAIMSANWTRSFAHTWNPVLSMAAAFGNEHNEKGRHEYSRDIYSVRALINIQPQQRLGFGAGISFINSRFKDNFSGSPFFPKRKDNYSALDLSGVYALDRNWSVKTEATYASQKSNIGLYKFDRSTFAIKLRYDYK
jgi:hypothetical protein